MIKMTPTKIVLEVVNGVAYLRVHAPQAQKGYYAIEAVPLINGKTPRKGWDGYRKTAIAFAKQHSIPFEDRTA
jgi:hypothetical protein